MTGRSRPGDRSGGDRLAWLLAATAVGVYLLVIAGTTTAVVDAASACPTWPVCEGPVLGDGALGVAGSTVTALAPELLVSTAVYVVTVVLSYWRPTQ
jgi:heme A synthase